MRHPSHGRLCRVRSRQAHELTETENETIPRGEQQRKEDGQDPREGVAPPIRTPPCQSPLRSRNSVSPPQPERRETQIRQRQIRGEPRCRGHARHQQEAHGELVARDEIFFIVRTFEKVSCIKYPFFQFSGFNPRSERP